MTRLGRLQDLCNKYGDFRVCIATRQPDGSILWSKHRSVLDCWHSQEGLDFLRRANNRTILRPEIVLDLDENPTKKALNKICDDLDIYGARYKAYFSGSRGFHVHILVPELVFLPRTSREGLRAFLIRKYGADFIKKSERVMIALENVAHYKTGQQKELVRESK